MFKGKKSKNWPLMFRKDQDQKGNLGRGLLLSGPVQAPEDAEVSQRPFLIFVTHELVSFPQNAF